MPCCDRRQRPWTPAVPDRVPAPESEGGSARCSVSVLPPRCRSQRQRSAPPDSNCCKRLCIDGLAGPENPRRIDVRGWPTRRPQWAMDRVATDRTARNPPRPWAPGKGKRPAVGENEQRVGAGDDRDATARQQIEHPGIEVHEISRINSAGGAPVDHAKTLAGRKAHNLAIIYSFIECMSYADVASGSTDRLAEVLRCGG